ncbi:MAG TPA: LuxR C-terminal-related transcriptional regulator [Thermoleophilaceae bacterium]
MFSDFEDATRLRGAAPDAMARAGGVHREILSEASARNGGAELAAPGRGTAAVAVFRCAADALGAVLDVQRAVRAQEWPDVRALRVRIALHTAEVKLGIERHHADLALGRCRSLAAIARGGQTLMSHATRERVVGQLPDGVEVVDLGVHRLPDLGRPEHVYGLADGDLPWALGAPRSLDTLPNNLPGELTSFVGREHELAEVARILDEARLLTLTGAGGCGKTRFALQASADALSRFPGGVWWVELAPVADPAMVGRALADAVGVGPLPGQSALEAAVAHLKARRALVLLDNCEHLLAGAVEAAQALLRGCPAVTIVATSRAPLGVPAETTWRVPSLSLPGDDDAGDHDALAESDAVRLFVERAAKVRPELTLTDATVSVLGEICSELDGIPLAIELAAARVRLLSVEQIAAGLSDRFRLLTGGARTGLPRHRTLRASVDWSHALLSKEERTLLRRLGVFAGGFTLEAAEQVCAVDERERIAIIDMLASLVDRSLVAVEERGPSVRYRLLETVREYELERLSEAEELDSIRDRHRDFFLALAERVAPPLGSVRVREERGVLDAEEANLTAALAWATATDGERALRLCAALIWWWMQRGFYMARDAACARALERAGPEPTPLRSHVLSARALLLTYAARYEEATVVAHDALAVAEEVGDPAEIGRALVAFGQIALTSSDPGEIRPLQDRGRELLRASGEDFWLVTTTQTRAWCHLICAEYDEGEALLEEVFPIIERRGYPERMWWHWQGMALRHQTAGDSERFFELTGRALEASQELGSPHTESYSNVVVAVVELAQGRTAQALARLQASRERLIASGSGVSLAATEYMLATAEATLGNLDGARARLEAVGATIAGSGVLLGWTLAQLADVLRVGGDAAGAGDSARRGLEVNERVGTPHGISWCKEILGRLAAERGDWSEAEALLHEALASRAERRLRLWLPQTLDALAEVARGLAAYEEATRLLGAAERARSDLGLVRWAPDEPRFEALARGLRGEMGDDAFGAAWAEGTRLTLEQAIGWVRRARGSRKRPPGGWEGLTPTELEVTRHAAAGLTNAEIGEAMLIAPGTVKTHLSHIYAKLGLRNRAALTAEAVRRLPADSLERQAPLL